MTALRLFFNFLVHEFAVAQQRREAKKLAQKSSASSSYQSSAASFALPEDPVPETQEGREAYFMKNLQLGEQLMMQGD